MLFLQLQNSVVYSTISASNKFEHTNIKFVHNIDGIV